MNGLASGRQADPAGPFRRASAGRNRRGSGKRGFTLIELLVVIAVLALLVSILTPSLREALEYSRLVACRMNMRNLSMACMIYVNDNYDYFVPGAGSWLNVVKFADDGRYNWGWPARLVADGSIDQTGMLACPGFRMPYRPGTVEGLRRTLNDPPDVWLRDTHDHSDLWWCNYSLHTYNGTSHYYVDNHHFSAMFPERKIMMAEAMGGWLPKPWQTDHGGQNWKYGTYHGPAFDSEINIAFSDGSIASVEDYADTEKWDWGDATFYDRMYYPSTCVWKAAFWRHFKRGGRPK